MFYTVTLIFDSDIITASNNTLIAVAPCDKATFLVMYIPLLGSPSATVDAWKLLKLPISPGSINTY